MNARMQTVAAGAITLALAALVGWHATRMPVDAYTTQGGAMSYDIGSPADRDAADMSPRTDYTPATARRAASRPAWNGITVPAGTPVYVTVHQTLSTKSDGVGDTWSGEVSEPVYRNGRVVIPAGSTVRGTVVASRAPRRGERAALQLAMSSIVIDGRTHRIHGSSEAVVAGSPRTRNIGAIAGGTAAGALLGKAVGGSSRSTLIGAAVGGAAATGAVAASKGYQATIKAGRELTFTTTSSVNVRA